MRIECEMRGILLIVPRTRITVVEEGRRLITLFRIDEPAVGIIFRTRVIERILIPCKKINLRARSR